MVTEEIESVKLMGRSLKINESDPLITLPRITRLGHGLIVVIVFMPTEIQY